MVTRFSVTFPKLRKIRLLARFLTLVLLLLSPAPVISQSSEYRSEQLPPEIGFGKNGISNILEDHRGFLWLATWSGLAKYDGYSVKRYRQESGNANGLKSNRITHLFEDSGGVLWIGTEDGLNRFNPETGQFVHYEHEPSDARSLRRNFVYSIKQTPDGSLWVGTDEGLNRMVGKDEQEYFVRYKLAPKDIQP